MLTLITLIYLFLENAFSGVLSCSCFTLSPVWTTVSSLTFIVTILKSSTVTSFSPQTENLAGWKNNHLHRCFRSKPLLLGNTWCNFEEFSSAESMGASLLFWEELTGEDPERASADIRHIYSLSEHIRAWEYRRAPRAPVLMLTAPIPCCLSRDPFWTPFISRWYITACKSRTADIRLCSDLTIFIRHGTLKKKKKLNLNRPKRQS